MSSSDQLFVFEESTELSPPKPSLAKRLSKKFSRKPFTERFIRNIGLDQERLETLQTDIDFSKKFYKESPMVCIDILLNVAIAQLNGIQQLALFRNLLIYERTHLKRPSIDGHILFLLSLDRLSDYIPKKRH